ncbi:MAG: sensor histidine kinase [Mesorhizobium sp.]|nr:MAG: sensor histidine kinase [Mesorhizobium sp.]
MIPKRLLSPTVTLYIVLAIALTLGCWSFVQSERYRRATDLTLSQTYEIQWRSTQIRERIVRAAGWLRLASKTGEIDPALERDTMLVGINVDQLLALEYVGQFLNQKEVDLLLRVRDIIENQVAPIAASGKGFDQALRYMDEVEQHMFAVSGAAVAHSMTLNETAQIAIAATRNSFVFALALTLVVLGLIIVSQRAQFARRRDQHVRSFSSLYAHMTRSRVTALRLFLDYLKDQPSPSPEMLRAADDTVKELDGINDGLLRIAYSERDPRTEPLGELLQRIQSARDHNIRMEIDNAARGLPVPATQVHLIVDELVSNAVTAVRGKADAEVTIRARLLNRSFPFGRRLLIEVIDNGGGMAPDILEKATAPFFSTRAGAHVGLGLTGCAQMVNTMRGKFRITSTPGIGTLVRILLPLATTGVTSPSRP